MSNFKIVFATAALATAAVSADCLAAEPVSTVTREDRGIVDKIAARFTERLMAGDAKGAVAVFTGASPLMSGKTAEISNLEGQVQTALNIYGPVVMVELASEQTIGTSIIHRYYLARHEKLVTRWQLDFAHTGSGWSMTYFGFDDKQPTWYKD